MLYKKNMTSYKLLYNLWAVTDTIDVAAGLVITISYTNKTVY